MPQTIGLMTLTVAFHKAAQNVSQRLKNGVVALIVRDAESNKGIYSLGGADDVPSALTAANQTYISQAFMGWINQPRQVIVSVMGAEDSVTAVGAAALAAADFDYLAGPPDVTAEEAAALAAWLKTARAANCIGKLVLPNYAGDSAAVVNFTASGLKAGNITYTAGQYCARIAGILAGTPIAASASGAVLDEVTAVDALEDPAAAIAAGKLILLHDGRKAYIARAVNSLQTLNSDTPASMKKIKIVEAVDLITSRIKQTVDESWRGRRANSYDNKQVLASAVHDFMLHLEAEGVVAAGTGYAEIDVQAQREWLRDRGADVSELSDGEIRAADTGTYVFLTAGGTLLDAMEDFQVNFYMGGNAL